MQPFASAPRTLVWLLAAVVVVLVLQAVLFIPSPLGILWPALVAALSLGALFGSRGSAVALKYLFYVMSAASAFFAITKATSPLGTARALAVAVLLFAVALYFSRSSAVANFYAQTPAVPEAGG